jgi:hypothetical protein
VNLVPAPGPGGRLDGRRFTLAFVAVLVVGLGLFFGLREKRIRDWRAAGGESIREGVTLPVRRR